MRLSLIVLMSVFTFATSAGAQEFGKASEGRSLAVTWCKSCHLIDHKQIGIVQDGVPSFPAIAKKLKLPKERQRIPDWLTRPHGAMASISLSRQDIADVMAYIETLNTKPNN
jgi:mono/diheme cytochrome c family protein